MMISRPLVTFALLCGMLGAADSSSRFDLQAAIDALPATGGVVQIPAGTIEITAPIVVRSGDVRLEGAGAATHIINRNTARQPALVLRHPNYGKTPRDNKARLWRITLANFRISGSKESG